MGQSEELSEQEEEDEEEALEGEEGQEKVVWDEEVGGDGRVEWEGLQRSGCRAGDTETLASAILKRRPGY